MNMKDCYICGPKDTKYSCRLCSNTTRNLCAESAICNEEDYDEDNYSVGKCLRGECIKADDVCDAPVAMKYNPVKLMGNIGGSPASSDNASNNKPEGKEGKEQNIYAFFSNNAARKRKNEDDTQRKSQDVVDAVVKVFIKWAKGGEDKRDFNVNEARDNKERTASAIQSAFEGDSSDL